jgi:uncharacterized protein (DUF305 family)
MHLVLRLTVLATACATTATAQSPQPAAPPDVAFMKGMISHHAQAIAMSALVPSRTSREDIHLLAERIDVSQKDEIATMQRWLREHGIDTVAWSGDQAHHDMPDMPGMSMPLMPGMLTPRQMADLAALKDTAFARRFLESMIHHHEGALTMVAQLTSQRNAAQDPQVFSFASDVDADQRAEIARMRRLLDAMTRK